MNNDATASWATEKRALGKYQFWRKVWLAVIGFGLLGLSGLVASHWQHYGGHSVIEGVGLILIAVAVVGRMWCTLYIGERKAAQIVDGGPYSIMRNPLYFFSSIGVAGVGAQTGIVSIALLFGLASVIAFHFVIAREEAFLSTSFGQTYANYCANTPRFWPNPRLYRSFETIQVHPKRLANTLADGLVFLFSIPLMEAIEHLQFAGVITPLLYLW